MKTFLLKYRKFVLILILSGAVWFAYPVARAIFFFFADPPPSEEMTILLDEEFADDASRANKSPHSGIVTLSADLDESVKLLRSALLQAKDENKSMIPMGARHSMGKQAIKENAILINTLSMNGMSMEGELLRVQAGARWIEVIDFLAQKSKTVEIMQSNCDFSIGGTLSVNAHGWQPGRPPVGSSVKKITVMTADGKVLECTRAQNADLFRHAIGGYGLFGIILEVWIKTVPNHVLTSSTQQVRPDEFPLAWEQIKREGAELAYGRLCIAPDSFFGSVLLNAFYSEDAKTDPDPRPYEIDLKAKMARAIFRASLGSDRGKEFRHWMETALGGEASGTHTRSKLLSEPVRVFGNNDPEKRDLLFECFVPKGKFPAFVEKARGIIGKSCPTILNVTVREITHDSDSALPYATQDVFGLVMLFTIDRNREAETKTSEMAGKLIDLSTTLGGSFYLPYRNFASREQVLKAYPGFVGFLEKKRLFDPDEIFSSGFYQKYR